MQKELSTFQFIKKLFAPVWNHPKLWMTMVWATFMRTSKSYISLLIMQYIVQVMESKDYNAFQTWVVALTVFYIFFQLITWVLKDHGWVRFWFPFKKVLHQIIIPQYINLDNTATEKIWTGKTINIIDTGLNARTDAVMQIIEYTIISSFALWFGIYYTAKIWWIYLLFYFVGIVFMVLLVVIINRKVIYYRNLRRDNMTLRTHQAVKIIMSKFEILLSWKTQQEVSHLDYYMDESQKYNLSQNKWHYWIFNIPLVFVSWIRIFIYFYLWYWYFNWVYSLSQFTGFLWLVLIFDKTLIEIVDFYKDFTKNLSEYY
jgi:ABC-type multidrug transport system fused ATPase/permease subunit